MSKTHSVNFYYLQSEYASSSQISVTSEWRQRREAGHCVLILPFVIANIASDLLTPEARITIFFALKTLLIPIVRACLGTSFSDSKNLA